MGGEEGLRKGERKLQDIGYRIGLRRMELGKIFQAESRFSACIRAQNQNAFPFRDGLVFQIEDRYLGLLETWCIQYRSR